jgi:hypothetical protein
VLSRLFPSIFVSLFSQESAVFLFSAAILAFSIFARVVAGKEENRN